MTKRLKSKVEYLLLSHPELKVQDIMKLIGVSRSMVFYVKKRLVDDGKFEPNRRSNLDGELNAEPIPQEDLEIIAREVGVKTAEKKAKYAVSEAARVIRKEINLAKKEIAEHPKQSPGRPPNPKYLDTGALLELLNKDEGIVGPATTDDDIRTKLLRQVQLMAFDPNTHPDTRLSATQMWVKLKDMAKEKDIGPGLPLSEPDAIDRLVRLMKAVGAKVVIKALELAFKKGAEYAKTADEQVATPSGASEVTSTS